MDFDSGNPLPSFEQQALEKFFNEERESMAAEGYAVSKEATLRKVALNVILKVSASGFLFGSYENERKRNLMNGTLRILCGK